MAKRYHYDSKGRLKGYSSNKYQPGLKDVAFIVILLIVGGALGLNKSGNNKSADAHAEVSASTTAAPGADRSAVVDRAPQTLEEQGYFAEQPRADNPSGFDRDLRPYYEGECKRGDQSACMHLEVEARRERITDE